MKFNPLITAAAILAAAVPAYAQSSSTSTAASTGTAASATPAADMTAGEVRKVDKENKKITIKHGEIKNLEMPGMTMVFQVKEPAMLDTVKPGDKVSFKVEKTHGALVVTEIRLAQ